MIKNKVTCGANQYEDNFIGSRISQVKKEMKDVLNIASDAQVLVCGKKVDDNYIVQEGDAIEFVKEAGDKG